MARVPGMTPGSAKKKSQLGGTGPDADGGKERTDFEDDRRERNQGGSDRPEIYKPKDDGERGGYVNRSTGRTVNMGLTKTKGLPVIDKRTVKQKLADASRRRSQ